MFCPGCGVEDRNQGQFCRACGIDLQTIRTGLIRIENAGSSVTAREEIGRAVAAKIRDIEGAKQLKKVVEEVLPQVERFLESPAERKLRRLRAGVVTSGVGIGIAVFFALMALMQRDLVPGIGVGVLLFLIGIAVLVNGWLFTVARAGDAEERAEGDRLRDILAVTGQGESGTLQYLAPPPSVIEHTTRNLESRSTGAADSRVTE